MTEDDIEFQGLPTDAAAAAFAGGQFDCVGVFAPFTLQALEREGSHVLFSSADFPGAISDHLVATADAVEEHPDELQKLVDAWYLTLDWIAANPDEATAIMADAGRGHAGGVRGVRRGHDDLRRRARRSTPSRTGPTTRPRCRRWPGGSTRSSSSPG